MRLRILLAKVNPEAITVPTRCAYAGCGGRKFHLRQEVTKPLRDTVYQEVQVHRYQCLRAHAPFTRLRMALSRLWQTFPPHWERLAGRPQPVISITLA